jgi:hypothetical protein
VNWIKRNKFFAIALVLAIGMLGGAGYYDWQSWSRNAAAFGSLNEIYDTLTKLTHAPLSPGNETVDNIGAAQEQIRRLREWNSKAGNYFQPIEPIPSAVAGAGGRTEEFSFALSRTLAQMQHDAAVASVALPPDFPFSFTAERNRMTFAPGSLGPLSAQLGEAKAITGILYAAQINRLESLQRVRVSDDDNAGPQSDYITESPVTNEQAVLTPWQITFLGFSPQIAAVLDGMAASPHGIIVNGINVQRDETEDTAQPGMENNMPRNMPGYINTPDNMRDDRFQAARRGRGGLQTVLDEQLLRVTVEIEIVKLTPGN